MRTHIAGRKTAGLPDRFNCQALWIEAGSGLPR